MKILFSTLLIFLLMSCGGGEMHRRPAPGFGFTNGIMRINEDSVEYKMYKALHIDDKEEQYKKVEELLKAGANPDKCYGQIKWVDTNPLWNYCGDYNLAKLLISYGADVKKRPYVASLLSYQVMSDKNPRKEWVEFYKNNPDMQYMTESHAYKCCETLLEAGADPNMKATFGEAVLFPASDWNYNRYFKKYGKTAINFCIRKNLLTIFSLLIKYGARLDEDSLQFAKEITEHTDSSEMEELVLAQWQIQTQGEKK